MQQKPIRLEKVTEENVEEIVKLRVAKDQRQFVASNKWSLIDAYFSLTEQKPVLPFGIFRGKTPVGFIMLSYDTDWTGYEREAWLNSDAYRFYRDRPYYYIWRFMIDKRFQGRGYGREALLRTLEFIRTRPCGEADFCVISYAPKNEGAKKLYRSLGFVELNEPGYYEKGDEVSAVLEL